MNQTLHNDEIQRARNQLTENPKEMVKLRPLPAIALQVSQACKDPKVDTKALCKLVECDPVFVSKILGVANSSMYGYTRELNSIHQALVLLGRKSVVQLAISVATQKVFSSGKDNTQTKQELFDHSLGCASVARAIANQEKMQVDSGTAFLGGILHDVGKLVFLDLAPNVYEQVLSNSGPEVSSIETERQLFGVEHTTVGSMFGESWELALPIRNVITNHHSLDDDSPLNRTILLANQLAKIWGIGRAPEGSKCEIANQWLEQRTETIRQSIQAEAVEHFNETKALLVS